MGSGGFLRAPIDTLFSSILLFHFIVFSFSLVQPRVTVTFGLALVSYSTVGEKSMWVAHHT